MLRCQRLKPRAVNQRTSRGILFYCDNARRRTRLQAIVWSLRTTTVAASKNARVTALQRSSVTSRSQHPVFIVRSSMKREETPLHRLRVWWIFSTSPCQSPHQSPHQIYSDERFHSLPNHNTQTIRTHNNFPLIYSLEGLRTLSTGSIPVRRTN
jgi:hypothetical protein